MASQCLFGPCSFVDQLCEQFVQKVRFTFPLCEHDCEHDIQPISKHFDQIDVRVSFLQHIHASLLYTVRTPGIHTLTKACQRRRQTRFLKLSCPGPKRLARGHSASMGSLVTLRGHGRRWLPATARAVRKRHCRSPLLLPPPPSRLPRRVSRHYVSQRNPSRKVKDPAPPESSWIVSAKKN